VHGVCGTSDIEIGKGYIKQFESRWWPLDLESNGLGLNERPVSIRETVMSQQSVRQAARRSALDAQAALREERVDRERRLEGLAVEALTALSNETRRSPHPNNAPGPASQATIAAPEQRAGAGVAGDDQRRTPDRARYAAMVARHARAYICGGTSCSVPDQGDPVSWIWMRPGGAEHVDHRYADDAEQRGERPRRRAAPPRVDASKYGQG
jgi:hypothetical protein